MNQNQEIIGLLKNIHYYPYSLIAWCVNVDRSLITKIMNGERAGGPKTTTLLYQLYNRVINGYNVDIAKQERKHGKR